MLVIIGLIVGGVLVGQDLISAANIRSQISQIEKYQTAVNTFRVKYGYLPGDIPDPTASSFGFTGRIWGMGNGDGLLQGGWTGFWNVGWGQGAGETMLFWTDLSKANLIGENFSKAALSPGTGIQFCTTASTPGLFDYYPVAKIFLY